VGGRPSHPINDGGAIVGRMCRAVRVAQRTGGRTGV
jgi:hypothetical protein